MARMGFFDVENRYAALDARHDPLVKINALVPCEAFRNRPEAVWRKPPDQRKSNAGCKPRDAIIMFKAIASGCAPSATCRTIRSSTRCATASPWCVPGFAP